MDAKRYSRIIMVSIVLTHPKFSLALVSDLNNEQKLDSTDLPADVEVFSHHSFEILKQPTRCSHRNLTKCHINEEMYYSYYDNCYKEVCSKKEYFCRNSPNGNTFHICGKSDECKKRRRNISVHDSVHSNILHVYSIPCPVGYFQPNKKICFDSCEKDISIVVKETEEHKHVVARCKSEDGYCNAKRVTYFKIGMEDDNCVLANMDLKISCGEGKSLMPDCSCAENCEENEERDWSDSLTCKPKQSSSLIVNDHTTIKAILNGVSFQDSSNSSQQIHSQTSPQNKYKKATDKPRNDEDTFKKETDGIHSSHLVLIVVIALFFFILVIVLIFIALVIWKKLSESQRAERIIDQDPEAPGNSGNKKLNGNMDNKMVIQQKKIGTVVHLGPNARDVRIYPACREHPLPQSHSDKFCIHSISDKEEMSSSEQAILQPLIKDLKSPDEHEDDSGVHTMTEETALKKVL